MTNHVYSVGQVNAYIKKEKRPKINNLHIKKLGKEE